MAQKPLVCQGRFFVEASRSHADTPGSVRLLWTSNRPTAETCIWQGIKLTTDKIHAPCWIRTHKPSKQGSKRPQFHALDRAATGAVYHCFHHLKTLRFAHRMHLCVLFGSHSRQRLFPHIPLTNCFFITEAECVYCAVRLGSLEIARVELGFFFF